jgi:hypothetical protein
VRDLSQPRGISDSWSLQNDSVIGVQGAWRINPQLEAVVQAMSRYSYNGTFNPEISWAYVKYEPTPNLSLRAGRLGTEFFMMADSRWVGYSFLTVRPPGDYFWYLPFYTIHGADAALTVPLGESLLRGKVFYGLSNGKIPLADRAMGYQRFADAWRLSGIPARPVAGPGQLRQYPLRARSADCTVLGKCTRPCRFDWMRPFPVHRDKRTTITRWAWFTTGPLAGPVHAQSHRAGNQCPGEFGWRLCLLGYRVGTVTPYLGYSWVRSNERERMRGQPD